jgi:acetyl esterase/lipase
MDYHWAGQQLVSSGKNLPHHVVWTLVVAIAIAIAISLLLRSKKRSSSSRLPSSAAPDDDDDDGKARRKKKNHWSDRVHPELGPPPPVPTFDTWWKVRAFGMLASIPGRPKSGVRMKKVEGIGTYYYPANNDSKEDIDDDIDAPDHSILWIHGGGRIMGSSCGIGECHTCSKIVLMFSVPVLAADYRKPPDHPFPAALDDVHRAYHWLSSKSKGGGRSRIAVAGLSAGGGLAAELCQRLFDESIGGGAAAGVGGDDDRRIRELLADVPLPACQLLLDPMLDDRTSSRARSESSATTNLLLPPHPVWNDGSNSYAWSLYLGPHRVVPGGGEAPLPRYASAARRSDLSGLPPALILVGDLDLFHGECAEYARRLKSHGVETEFAVTGGGYHAFMCMKYDAGPSVECWGRFHAFGTKFLFDQAISSS